MLKRWMLLATLVVSLMLLVGCGVQPLLSGVRFEPDVISPNADGKDDVTHIYYNLSRNADLSIYFVNQGGQRFFFRDSRRRSAGRYDVFWGGVIEGETTMQNESTRQTVLSRVLPDGTYTWVIEAKDDVGRVGRHEGRITIVDADTTVPALLNFAVSPPVFSPNQDGLDDRAGVTYSLSKNVENIAVYLIDPAKPRERFPLEERERTLKAHEAGFHYYDYDGGVDRGAEPPADGTYTVVGEARDRAGNHVIVTTTLTIVEGGVPRADIVKAEIDWQDAQGSELWLPLGATIYFTTSVENYGRVPIRTAGPWPGTAYRSNENFATLAAATGNDAWYEQAGVWRFGIRFDVSATDFPYRWAIGRQEDLERRVIDGREQWYLLPGKRGLVHGSIQLVDKPPRDAIYAWGALIHEWVSIKAENNYVDRILLHVNIP
ncbi:MAG: gliding motility-associated C-terminal domain-containing protein [Anaerolineae bacterium]|nr:gliding motility-associated C-terminal domain-containing protein [Anaerolineae bacterium]